MQIRPLASGHSTMDWDSVTYPRDILGNIESLTCGTHVPDACGDSMFRIANPSSMEHSLTCEVALLLAASYSRTSITCAMRNEIHGNLYRCHRSGGTRGTHSIWRSPVDRSMYSPYIRRSIRLGATPARSGARPPHMDGQTKTPRIVLAAEPSVQRGLSCEASEC